MPMPPQLWTRRRPRRSERPTVELLPAININDLRDAIPRDYGTNIYANPFRHPQVRDMRLACRSIKIVGHDDRVQVFGIEWIRTGFGKPRPIFVCSCGYGTVRLYARYGTYACRNCHAAYYTSQRQDSKGRKRFKACKLRLKLGGLPDINEPLAPKPKGRHRRRHDRLRNQVQALESAIRQKRFQKPIDTRIFAYHVG